MEIGKVVATACVVFVLKNLVAFEGTRNGTFYSIAA